MLWITFMMCLQDFIKKSDVSGTTTWNCLNCISYCAIHFFNVIILKHTVWWLRLNKTGECNLIKICWMKFLKLLFKVPIKKSTFDILNVQSIKKKRNTPFNSKANYYTEIKLIPINVDYCLLWFNALNFFLRVRLHGLVGCRF